MARTITGRLCARPCGGLEVPITDATVRFYRAGTEEGILGAAAARPKETFGIVPPENVEERADLLLAEGPLDGDGRFEVTVPEEAEYDPEEPLVVDVRVRNPCADGEGDGEPVQATITTVAPRWRESEGELRYSWEACLTRKQYCRILEEHGCWLVCGRITDCETGDGLPGLDVEVFDADIVQPDPLGSDRTDADGWYVVYYDRPAFEVTPAQFAPVELIGGADLFFTVRRGTNVLLDESPGDGRRGGREDADRCEHVDLCVDFPDDDVPSILPAAWTRVGRYLLPDSNGLNGFDRDGYAGTEKFAFFGTLPLEGSIPVGNVPIQGAGSDPVRYRFRVEDSPRLKNGARGNPGGFNRIVGDGNSLFARTHVGDLVYRSGATTDLIQVRVEPGDLNPGGWVRVDRAIKNAYGSSGSRPAPLSDYRWVPSGDLARLDTEPLTTEPDVPLGAAGPGDPVPGSDRIADEQVAIRFEAQERTSGGWQALPGDGRTLNRIVVNNNPEFRKLDVVQLGNEECRPITTADVDLEYTLYHPHLRGAELEMRRADQGSWTTLNDSSTELSFFNNGTTDARFDHNYNDRSDISGEVPKECTYLVRLRSRRRLTTGRSADHWSGELRAFYAESP